MNFLYLPLSTCTDPQKVQVTTWYTNFCLALQQASKAQPQASACTRRSKNACVTLSVQASGVFCLDLLALALCLWAIPFHVAHFTTQVTFATKPFSSSSSQQHPTPWAHTHYFHVDHHGFHGGAMVEQACSAATAAKTQKTTLHYQHCQPTSWHDQHRSGYPTLHAVAHPAFNPCKYANSKSWVLIRLRTSNIIARNSSLYRATEDHYRRSNKRDWWRRAWCRSRNSVSNAWQKSYHVQIPNLAQFSLATESPPGQHLPHQQVTAILTIFRWLHHTCHFTELLDVERPICQLLGIPIKLLWLILSFILDPLMSLVPSVLVLVVVVLVVVPAVLPYTQHATASQPHQ